MKFFFQKQYKIYLYYNPLPPQKNWKFYLDVDSIRISNKWKLFCQQQFLLTNVELMSGPEAGTFMETVHSMK